MRDVARRHDDALATLGQAAARFPRNAELLRRVAVVNLPITHRALARSGNVGGFGVARGTLDLARGDAATALAPCDPNASNGLRRAGEILTTAADGHRDLARGREATAAGALR